MNINSAAIPVLQCLFFCTGEEAHQRHLSQPNVPSIAPHQPQRPPYILPTCPILPFSNIANSRRGDVGLFLNLCLHHTVSETRQSVKNTEAKLYCAFFYLAFNQL